MSPGMRSACAAERGDCNDARILPRQSGAHQRPAQHGDAGGLGGLSADPAGPGTGLAPLVHPDNPRRRTGYAQPLPRHQYEQPVALRHQSDRHSACRRQADRDRADRSARTARGSGCRSALDHAAGQPFDRAVSRYRPFPRFSRSDAAR